MRKLAKAEVSRIAEEFLEGVNGASDDMFLGFVLGYMSRQDDERKLKEL
mgnify:CR=1 FL=1|tara:strand:+ start:615 stop:761 length:147 start_codon:yes stop_codon:yes gene_type:complete